jgi:uncharacterized protein (TIGR00369 family)
VYDEKIVKHVIFIAMSREMGFSLPFIAEYLPRFKAGKLSAQDMIEAILARVAEFNRWCGIEVTVAEPGFVEIQMPWRPEVGQYSGYLHAGLMGTLIDTACGFAAGTVAGPNLLAAHFSVNCLRPAVGQKFIARARVVKPGKAQVFTSCDLWAVDAEGEKLVANGQTLLTVVAA